MTAPVTVSERDLRTLLGIVQGKRDDLPEAGLPLSLLAELGEQVRCDDMTVHGANYNWDRAADAFMQDTMPTDSGEVDVEASDCCYWPEFTGYYHCGGGDLRSVTKVSDFYSARQWHNTRVYTDYMRPL